MNLASKEGPCIGGPHDGERHAFSKGWNHILELNHIKRLPAPTGPLPSLSSPPIVAESMVHRSIYHAMPLSANDAWFLVWRHQTLTPAQTLARLIEGYHQREADKP